MPFKALDFDARDTKDALSEMFSVRGIPTLVFVRRDGSILSSAGRSLVTGQGDAYPWDKRVPHKHLLTDSVAEGHACDSCGTQMPRGAAMHSCRPCNYDECAACYATAPPPPIGAIAAPPQDTLACPSATVTGAGSASIPGLIPSVRFNK